VLEKHLTTNFDTHISVARYNCTEAIRCSV